MAGLTARDAMVKAGAIVRADTSAADIQRLPRNKACAVFQDTRKLTKDQCVGVLPASDINERNDAPVGTMIAARPTMITDGQPVTEVLRYLRNDSPEYLPVFDNKELFVGLISQNSILEALLRRERQLLKKTREFRQTSNDDKERRYETTRRLEQTNLAFRKLLSSLSRPENLDSYKQALEALTVVADAGWAQLSICDEAGRVTQRVLACHPSADTHPPNYQAEQLMHSVISENKLLNRTASRFDVDGANGINSAVHTPHAAFLGVPLFLDERRFGSLYLWDKLRGKNFVDDDEVMLVSMAHAISLTLAQAIDHARRKRLETQLDLQAAIAQEVGGAGTIDDLCNIIRDKTDSYWNWDAFIISISRCHGRRFQSISSHDKALAEDGIQGPSEPYEHFADVPSEGVGGLSIAQVNRRVLSGEPVLINRQDLMGVEMLHSFGKKDRPSASLIFVPIRGKSRVLGHISIQSYKKNYFNLSDVEFLQRLSDAVGPAFHRCLAERRTTAFFELISALSIASTLFEAAHCILEVADEIIGWDSCYFLYYDEKEKVYKRVLSVDLKDQERSEYVYDDNVTFLGDIAAKAVNEGPILYLRPEARFDSQCVPFGNKSRPSASLMFVPLKFGGATLGLLSVQSYEINAYDQDDLDTLKALADQCSGTIERIRHG